MVSRAFLTAEWTHLLILTYAISPDLIRPHLPEGVEVDLYDGQAFVSLVGFSFAEMRVLRIPVPGVQAFAQLNLRTYVRRRVDAEWRRGVVFLKEICPHRLVTTGAGLLYNEPYVTAPLGCTHVPASRVPETGNPASGTLEFTLLFRGRAGRMAARYEPHLALCEAGSLAEFIVDRYFGYGASYTGRTMEFQVIHRPWQWTEGIDPTMTLESELLYGPAFGTVLRTEPAHTAVVDGSPVTVGWRSALPQRTTD